MEIPTITTPRLLLRGFTEADAEHLHHILQGKDVLRYFPNPTPPSGESVEKLIAGQLRHWQEHGFGWWAVQSRADGALLGWCGLGFLPETQEVEVAYLLGRPYWGQGLATEAARASLAYGFEKIKLERIVAIVHPENIASQRVAEKIGLTFVDENHYFGMDCYRYAIELPSDAFFALFRQAFGDIPGGRVLDIATGEGGFVDLLALTLRDYSNIVGIDISERRLARARTTYDRENVHFAQMDAGQLAFGEGSFDTVNISASLHHLADIPKVLAEMKRVLKPGGHLLITEMHRDGQTEAQRVLVAIHHWAAEVDTALGLPHNPTLTRQEILGLIQDLGLRSVACYDFCNVDSDPQEETALQRSETTIERYSQRVEEGTDNEGLKQRGEELRRRLRGVGVQQEPALIVVGQKE